MKTKKPKISQNLQAIYNDINSIKIDIKDSFLSCMQKFYAVMRKWGIKQGTWTKNGRSVCSAEWNMCFAVFKQNKILALDIWLVLNEPPSDLLAYGKEPVKRIVKKQIMKIKK